MNFARLPVNITTGIGALSPLTVAKGHAPNRGSVATAVTTGDSKVYDPDGAICYSSQLVNGYCPAVGSGDQYAGTNTGSNSGSQTINCPDGTAAPVSMGCVTQCPDGSYVAMGSPCPSCSVSTGTVTTGNGSSSGSSNGSDQSQGQTSSTGYVTCPDGSLVADVSMCSGYYGSYGGGGSSGDASGYVAPPTNPILPTAPNTSMASGLSTGMWIALGVLAVGATVAVIYLAKRSKKASSPMSGTKSQYGKMKKQASQIWKDVATLALQAREDGDEELQDLTTRASKGDPGALIELRPYLDKLRNSDQMAGSKKSIYDRFSPKVKAYLKQYNAPGGRYDPRMHELMNQEAEEEFRIKKAIRVRNQQKRLQKQGKI